MRGHELWSPVTSDEWTLYSFPFKNTQLPCVWISEWPSPVLTCLPKRTSALVGNNSKSRPHARFTILGPSKKVILALDVNLHYARYWGQPQTLSNSEFDLFTGRKTCRSISGKVDAEMVCCFVATYKHYSSRSDYKQIRQRFTTTADDSDQNCIPNYQ